MDTVASAAAAAATSAGSLARGQLLPPMLLLLHSRQKWTCLGWRAAAAVEGKNRSRSTDVPPSDHHHNHSFPPDDVMNHTACCRSSVSHIFPSRGGCCSVAGACCSARRRPPAAPSPQGYQQLQERKSVVDLQQMQEQPPIQQDLVNVQQHYQKQHTAKQSPHQTIYWKTITGITPPSLSNPRTSNPYCCRRFFYSNKKEGSSGRDKINSSRRKVLVQANKRYAAVAEGSRPLLQVLTSSSLLLTRSRPCVLCSSSGRPSPDRCTSSSSSEETRHFSSNSSICRGWWSPGSSTSSFRRSCVSTGRANTRSSRSSSGSPTNSDTSSSSDTIEPSRWSQYSRSSKFLRSCSASLWRRSSGNAQPSTPSRKQSNSSHARRCNSNSCSSFSSVNEGPNCCSRQAPPSSTLCIGSSRSLTNSGTRSLTSGSSSSSRRPSSNRNRLLADSSSSCTQSCSSSSILASRNRSNPLCHESPPPTGAALTPWIWLQSTRYSCCRRPGDAAVSQSHLCAAGSAAAVAFAAAQPSEAAVAEEKLTLDVLRQVDEEACLDPLAQQEQQQQQRLWKRQQRQRRVPQEQHTQQEQQWCMKEQRKKEEINGSVPLLRQRQERTTLQQQQQVTLSCGARGFSSSSSAAAAGGGGRSSTKSRSSVGQLLGSSENSLVDVPVPPKPRKYFDLKTFQRFLLRYKQREEEAEEALIRRTYTKPLPEGWTVLTFLNRIGITENAAEAVVNAFPSWVDLANASVEALSATEGITNQQRRLIVKHIRLYNHGLWPENTYEDYIDRFQAEPLANEGKPWTPADDQQLLELARKYDVNFGDPWLYISWEMQRDFEDVQSRYTELVTIPRNKSRRCEVVLTKCTKPLFFSRYFKLLPPTLFVIPSTTHFCTDACLPFTLPKEFLQLRRDCCFRQPPPSTSASPSSSTVASKRQQ